MELLGRAFPYEIFNVSAAWAKISLAFVLELLSFIDSCWIHCNWSAIHFHRESIGINCFQTFLFLLPLWHNNSDLFRCADDSYKFPPVSWRTLSLSDVTSAIFYFSRDHGVQSWFKFCPGKPLSLTWTRLSVSLWRVWFYIVSVEDGPCFGCNIPWCFNKPSLVMVELYFMNWLQHAHLSVSVIDYIKHLEGIISLFSVFLM